MTTTSPTPAHRQTDFFAPALSIQKRRKPDRQGRALRPTSSEPEKPNSQPQTETHPERVVRLIPRLHHAARALDNTTSRSLDDDDLTQDMALFLLEHPEIRFDGACVKFAKRRALSRLTADTTYRRYVDTLPVIIDDDGDEADLDDFIPDPTASPEEQLLTAERLAEMRAQLKPVQLKIVECLMVGYLKSEIADHLGIYRQDVSRHLQHIRALLNHVWPVL